MAEKDMHPSVARAFEEIDAAVFTGDDFHNAANLKILANYIGRWAYAMQDKIDFALGQENEDDGN